MITRRSILRSSVAGGALALGWGPLGFAQDGTAFEVTHTDAEWRALLGRDRFDVLRGGGTETPGSSALLAETRPGVYACAGCELAVYPSEHKYEAGTGWLSFWRAADNAVRTAIDESAGYRRTEVHCRRCGGHFGHIINDGPRRTAFALFFGRPGQRHSVNGMALNFLPA